MSCSEKITFTGYISTVNPIFFIKHERNNQIELCQIANEITALAWLKHQFVKQTKDINGWQESCMSIYVTQIVCVSEFVDMMLERPDVKQLKK